MQRSAHRTLAARALWAPALALAFMAVAAGWSAPTWERAFRSDASPVAWLSSALLVALAAMAWRLRLDASLPPRLAAWLAIAMLGLAVDEQFMLHELWKYRCEEWTSLCQHAGVRELPMLWVGVLGLLTARALHCALPSPWARGLLGSGVAVGLWALAVDQLPMPYPIAELEEAFEVLAESLVLAALLQVQSSSTQAPAANH